MEYDILQRRALWISFPRTRVWGLLFAVLLALSVTTWSSRARGAEAAGQRGRGVKAGRMALLLAGSADVPQQGPTNLEAEKINRHC